MNYPGEDHEDEPWALRVLAACSTLTAKPYLRMHPRTFVVGTAGVIASTLLVFALWRSSLGHLPMPSVETIEDAEISNQAGEIFLVTLSHSFPPTNTLNTYMYIKVSSVEARITNRWIAVPGTLGTLRLSSSHKEQYPIVIPTGADACRLTIKFTGAALSFKGQLESVAAKMPNPICTGMPYAFWRWIGFNRLRPASYWKTATLELPLPKNPTAQ